MSTPVEVPHNHEWHNCSTKVIFNMEPFIGTPQLGTEEGKKLHTCCRLDCELCNGYCSVW